MVLSTLPASAQTYDADTTTPGVQDGAGIGWNTTNLNWWNGSGDVVWANTATSDATFGAGGPIATPSVPVSSVTVGSVIVNDITINAPGSTNFRLTGGTITLSGATPTISTSDPASAEISSTIAGSAGLIKAGTGTLGGTLMLSGNNTYTGATTVSGGTLNGATPNAFGGTSSITVATNAALGLGDGTYNIPLTLNGDGAAGATTGALIIGSATVNLTAPITLASDSRIQNVGTLNISSDITGTSQKLSMQGASSTSTISGKITLGTGGLGKYGTGTLILSGANSYSGTTDIGSGTLRLAAANTIPDTSSVNANGTFDLNGFSDTIGSLTGSGAVNLGSGSLTVGADSSDTTYTGTINGSGTLTKIGTGTLTLITGTNTYFGLTTVSAGVLEIRKASSLGSTAAGTTVASGAALQVRGAVSYGAEPLTLNGTGVSNRGALRSITGAPTFSGAITLGSDSRINADAGTLTLSNTISSSNFALTVGGAGSVTTTSAGTIGLGSGSLTKDGAGTFTLGAAATYTGATTISAGTLALGASNLLDNATNVSVGSSGTFNLGGFSETINSLAGAGNVTLGAGTLTTGTSNSNFSGTLSGTGGSLVKTGGGTFTLSGSNSYTGTTSVNAGSLRVGLAGTGSTGTGAVTVASTATLLGTGTVAGSSATFASGSTLAPGDATAPGSYGKLTFNPTTTGAYDLQTGSTVQLAFAAATSNSPTFGGNPIGSPGYNSWASAVTGVGLGSQDLLQFNGAAGSTLAFSPNLTVTAPGYVPAVGDVINLIDWNNANVAANFTGFSAGSNFRDGSGDNGSQFDLPDISASGLRWDVSLFPTSGVVVVVPEPASLTLAGLGLATLTLRRRRNQPQPAIS